ncbi:MAG: type II secretion system F family protein [Candidatus Moraniibacteriota bacterium]
MFDIKRKEKKELPVKKEKRHRIMLFLIPNEEKEYFIESLSMLFSSGMNIIMSLESIKKETRSAQMREIIDRLKEDVDAGLPIWKVLEEVKFFPSFIISLIMIGEKSGSLAKNLKAIAIQQKKDRVFNSKIRSAMMYPAFVLGLTLIVGIGIAWFILPRLTQVFDQLKIDLPLITRILIAFGKFIDHYGSIVIPSFVFGLILLFYFIFAFSKTKFIGQFLLFSVPAIRRLVQETELARMGYILGTLLKSGLPIRDAMTALTEASTFYKYKKLYVYLEHSVEDGNTFQQSFDGYKNSHKLVPATIQQMIMVGEESGQLPEMFISIGQNFEEKIENTTKNLTTLLEPILLVIVWLGVVAVALAVILPIYSLIGGLNKSKGTNSKPAPITNVVEDSNAMDTDKDQIDTEGEKKPEEVVPVKNRIQIIETPTGFLNVRDTPSAKGKKIGKVLIGEQYVFQEEKDGWYKIVLSGETVGWVSGEYVKKLDN